MRIPSWLSHRPVTGSVLLVAASTALCLACQPSPAADRRLQMRTQHVQTTANIWARSEQSRPDRLRNSLEYIPPLIERQVASLRRTGDYVDEAAKRDVQRWQQRQPVYRDEVGRRLWGQPDRIEEDAITLFF